jgi:hypothetical protein
MPNVCWLGLNCCKLLGGIARDWLMKQLDKSYEVK